MSRASHAIPASLLILFTLGVPPAPAATAPLGMEPPRATAPSPSALPSAAERSSPATITAPDTLTGTVSYVHVDDETVHVITGVHLALRVIVFHVIGDTRIEKAGESVAIDDLTPGDIVRIDFRATPEGNVADAIRVVAPPAEGGAR